jgi:alkanesulfonate monooxygenase
MLTVYTSFPTDPDLPPEEYRRTLLDKCRWIEEAGCRGVLVHTDNRSVDPWSAAQFLLENTERLVPLIAVNPVYTHPFAAARAIATIGYLYHRQVDLNLVSGGFPSHLKELGCRLDHDERYDRITEYAQIITRLLSDDATVSHAGEHYTVKGAMLGMRFDPELMPRIYVSGGSEASLEARRRLGAGWLTYPRLLGRYGDSGVLQGGGVRFGIIVRPTSEEAWALAHARFPHDEDGEQLHDWVAQQAESRWHRNLADDVRRTGVLDQVYWLYPFRAYHTFCPYLVGDYDEVAAALAEYFNAGVNTIILNTPEDPEDLDHILFALRRARAAV